MLGNDAVRVFGPTNTVVDRLPEIEDGFKKSIAAYRTIRFLSLVIDDIRIRTTTPNEAVVEATIAFN